MNFPEPTIQSTPVADDVQVDVLRLDKVHPVVSGNKWYKLKYYLVDAFASKKSTILTFGGAYSNHIVATAAACAGAGLRSIGIIRGERPKVFSDSLADANTYGMDLYFISREEYRDKKIPPAVYERYNPDDVYQVDEGGRGAPGVKGATEITASLQIEKYDYILVAAGTGTTVAGLALAAAPQQLVIGISVLKNHYALEDDVRGFLPPEKHHQFLILNRYHFGGYAKFSDDIFRFMNEWYERTSIPTDFVYTGKLFYAVNDLILKRYFPGGSRVLVIHSGGLQGNRSLGKGTLIF